MMVRNGDEVDKDTLDYEDKCIQQATGSLIFVPKLVKSMHVFIHLVYNGEKVICYVTGAELVPFHVQSVQRLLGVLCRRSRILQKMDMN